ncbi:MAG TPA: hypothetical protein VN884_04470 [Candidatus Sulfotelmatobacter sp.]|nr:hypothetical protein [Candidatus Sulfotelmatobacter sp.]
MSEDSIRHLKKLYHSNVEVLILAAKMSKMNLRNEEKDWITTEIHTAIQEHLSPHGWKRLHELLPLAAVIGIFVALLSLAGAAWYYAFSKVEARATFETHTTETLTRTAERLTSVEGTLTVLRAQIAVQKYSTIPPKELKKHSEELGVLKKNLVQQPNNTPGYWPTAFQIITLYSQASFDTRTIADQRESSYSDVVFPQGAINTIVNQRAVLSNRVRGMSFKNCIIRFDPSVVLENDIFIDCVFIFPPNEQTPSRPLQTIGKTLLASDLSNVTINAS